MNTDNQASEFPHPVTSLYAALKGKVPLTQHEMLEIERARQRRRTNRVQKRLLAQDQFDAAADVLWGQKTTPQTEPAPSVPIDRFVRIPVKLWAQIGDQRIEVVQEVCVHLGEGHCPQLAREIFARPMAATLADMAIKTGWEFYYPNVKMSN